MTVETIGQFVIVFVRLILGKVGVDGFTGPRRKSDIRYECGLKVVVKGFEWKYRFLRPFLTEFPSNS